MSLYCQSQGPLSPNSPIYPSHPPKATAPPRSPLTKTTIGVALIAEVAAIAFCYHATRKKWRRNLQGLAWATVVAIPSAFFYRVGRKETWMVRRELDEAKHELWSHTRTTLGKALITWKGDQALSLLKHIYSVSQSFETALKTPGWQPLRALSLLKGEPIMATSLWNGIASRNEQINLSTCPSPDLLAVFEMLNQSNKVVRKPRAVIHTALDCVPCRQIVCTAWHTRGPTPTDLVKGYSFPRLLTAASAPKAPSQRVAQIQQAARTLAGQHLHERPVAELLASTDTTTLGAVARLISCAPHNDRLTLRLYELISLLPPDRTPLNIHLFSEIIHHVLKRPIPKVIPQSSWLPTSKQCPTLASLLVDLSLATSFDLLPDGYTGNYRKCAELARNGGHATLADLFSSAPSSCTIQ